MLEAALCKHGPAHVCFLLFDGLCALSPLAVRCLCEPVEMARVARRDVTPMSRLSQHRSRSRSHTGRSSDLFSPASLINRQAPKRKALSSRYTAVIPSKRRRLGLNIIRDPEADRTGSSPKACNNLSSVSPADKEARLVDTRGKGRKSKVGARGRRRGPNLRINAVRDLLAEVSPSAKLLDSEELSNEETLFGASCRSDLLHASACLGAASIPDGNHDRVTVPLSIKHGNLNVGEAGASLLARESDVGSMHAEPRQSVQKHLLIAKRGQGRKSKRLFSNLATSGFLQRISEDDQVVHIDNNNVLKRPSRSKGQEIIVQDATGASSLPREDGAVQEGSFLRPRRRAKTPANLEQHRLPPRDYVGKRVEVYWPHAKAWYAGEVIMYDDTTKKHKVKYDDGDEECISFRRHKVVLEKPVSVHKKGLFFSQITRFPKEEVMVHRPVKGNLVDDMCAVDDNELLSAFAHRHRVREVAQETSCNGSAMPSGSVKRLDKPTSNTITVHKPLKKSMPFAHHQDNTVRSSNVERGTVAGKEAFVYVRRSKGRGKPDAAAPAYMADGSSQEPIVAGATYEQDTSRKRKSRLSISEQGGQQDFLNGRFCDDESSCSDAPATLYTLGSSSNAEHSARKRNKRSIKNLVSQVSVPMAMGTEASREPELQQDLLHRAQVGRPKKKLTRKHKLKSARVAAMSRSNSFLPDHIGGQGFDGSSLTTCLNTGQPYDAVVQASTSTFETVSLFLHTINLTIPAVVPGLFTWQLFGILSWSQFCKSGSFDETFLFNGSIRDWKGIFIVLLRIIKAVPLSAYANGRQWQCIILHELWNFLRRCEPGEIDTLTSFPFEAEQLMSEQLLDASAGCKMSSRQILNLFVCYFIKPYVFTTLCEKGFSIQVVIRQLLLFARNQEQGMACLRQSVKRFPLKPSSSNVNEGFSTYLKRFLRSTDWFTDRGLFLRGMKEWIYSTENAGCAEVWNPVTALERLDRLVWQVTSTCAVHGINLFDEFRTETTRVKKLFRLRQESTKSEFYNENFLSCPGHSEARKRLSGKTHFLLNDPFDGSCINSALLYMAHLQKELSMSAGKVLGTTEAGFHSLVVCPPHREDSVAEKQIKGTRLIWQPGSSAHDTSETKAAAGLLHQVIRKDCTVFTSCQKSLSRASGIKPKLVKLEPDIHLSRRNSSITTESANSGIKEESSVEMFEHRELSNNLSLKADSIGQTPVGLDLKTNIFGHMEGVYYDNGVRMAKNRPRFRREQKRRLLKRQPTYFCIGDILFLNHECYERRIGARVEMRSNADSSFQISVRIDGKLFDQKIIEGDPLAKNPQELLWKSESSWVLEFPNKEQWELFRCMYNELCSQAMRATCAKEIPIPVVKELETSHDDYPSRPFLRPYFAMTSRSDEVDMAFKSGRVLYDLDSEDEMWIAEINVVNRDLGCGDISEPTLEQVIDRLEKEAYRRGETTVMIHDAIELCQGLAVADSVRAVHAYWTNKRHKKGMSVLRYFQPPLWEQYQDELQLWENRMQQYSSEAPSVLIDRYPRPVMSAFCLQSRSFDSIDNGKRMLRQRSQRKIRPTSRSCFDDSHRLPVCRDSDSIQHLTDGSECSQVCTQPYKHLDYGGQQEDDGLSGFSKAARAKAVEARRAADKRAFKLQHQFLEFDSALQRAWALLIEYTVSDGSIRTQTESLDGTMAHLFTSCSSAFGLGTDWSDDEPLFDLGQACPDVGEEFLEAFSKHCSLNGLCHTQG